MARSIYSDRSRERAVVEALFFLRAGTMARRRLYTNSDESTSVLSYFMADAARCETAQLACPFFTTVEPLLVLKRSSVRQIQLIVRLCFASQPDALKSVLGLPGVTVRYYANDNFHAKLYILGDTALIGSANLTRTGLKVNREIGVTLHRGDEVFEDLTAYFSLLWSEASPLDGEAFERFTAWHESRSAVFPNEYTDDDRERVSDDEIIVNERQPLFRGMSLRQAVIEQLNRVGRPQTSRELYTALTGDGFPVRSKNTKKPYKTIFARLFRRSQEHGDVLRSGPGQWALAEWYTAEEAEKLRQLHNQSQEHHVKRTKLGMLAAAERGVQIGARRILTTALKERVLQMARDGMTTIAIAKALGISVGTIQNGFPGGLSRLRKQGVLPPRRLNAMERRARKRVREVDAAQALGVSTSDNSH